MARNPSTIADSQLLPVGVGGVSALSQDLFLYHFTWQGLSPDIPLHTNEPILLDCEIELPQIEWNIAITYIRDKGFWFPSLSLNTIN